MITEKFYNCIDISSPVIRPSLEIDKYGSNAGAIKQCNRILYVFIKISVKNALVHEMRS